MIDISDKENCCGCSACVQKCPKQCIALKEDNEGFLYPIVDKDNCIDCGLCEKVCPVLSQNESRKPLKVYAAINKNEEIRRQSSSGGVFTLLAEKIINEGGIVFGARFDNNWEVKHDYTDTIEGLAAFRGSKYVQSRIEDNFQKAENFLKEGRKVLFSGTPCQIAGLKSYLRKDYDNLLAVDFICHGVPSPMVFRLYLDEVLKMKFGPNILSNNIKKIDFRDKSISWEKFKFVLEAANNGQRLNIQEEMFKNPYLRGFLFDLYLRPICHNCPTKELKSGSDITIADFWKIDSVLPEFYSSKGVSSIILNTNNGERIVNGIMSLLDCRTVCLDDVIKYNKALIVSSKLNKKRTDFFKLVKSTGVIKSVNRLTERSLFVRIVCRLSKFLKLNNI